MTDGIIDVDGSVLQSPIIYLSYGTMEFAYFD